MILSKFQINYSYFIELQDSRPSSGKTWSGAYHKLREVALRRFAEKHKNDPEWQRRLSHVSARRKSQDVDIENFITKYAEQAKGFFE